MCVFTELIESLLLQYCRVSVWFATCDEVLAIDQVDKCVVSAYPFVVRLPGDIKASRILYFRLMFVSRKLSHNPCEIRKRAKRQNEM